MSTIIKAQKSDTNCNGISPYPKTETIFFSH